MEVSLRRFAVVAAVCLIVGIGFGLAPAWYSANADINLGIREGSSPGGRTRWVATTTAAQVALAACVAPARRAIRVDPITLLRSPATKA